MDAEADFSGVENLVGNLNDLPDVLAAELEDAATDIAQSIVGDASREAPVDTGTLANDISGVVDSVGETILRIRVGSNLDYVEPMEEGADPFFPPPDELRRWAHRVLGDEDLAFVVARSISETGLEAREFLADAIDDNLTFFVDRTADAVDNAINSVGLS